MTQIGTFSNDRQALRKLQKMPQYSRMYLV